MFFYIWCIDLQSKKAQKGFFTAVRGSNGDLSRFGNFHPRYSEHSTCWQARAIFIQDHSFQPRLTVKSWKFPAFGSLSCMLHLLRWGVKLARKDGLDTCVCVLNVIQDFSFEGYLGRYPLRQSTSSSHLKEQQHQLRHSLPVFRFFSSMPLARMAWLVQQDDICTSWRVTVLCDQVNVDLSASQILLNSFQWRKLVWINALQHRCFTKV